MGGREEKGGGRGSSFVVAVFWSFTSTVVSRRDVARW